MAEAPVVRPFTWDQWPALWQLRRLQLAEHGIMAEGPPPAPDLTSPYEPDYHLLQTVYLRGRGGFWIAWLGGEPVGHTGGQDLGSHIELRRMYVRPGRRRRGVGLALVQTLIAHCQAQGVSRILLWTAGGGPGRYLYARCGFAVIAWRDRTGPQGLSVGPDEVRMERMLDQPRQQPDVG